MSNVMSWPDIVAKYGYDQALESQYHDPPEYKDPRQKHELFHCTVGGYGSEFEVSNFLRSLIMLFKFDNILETGAEQAHATMAMASACHYNGVGHVTTVDSCHVSEKVVKERLAETGLTPYVTQVKSETSAWAEQYDGPPFDFAFFDCGYKSRIKACNALLKNGKLSRMISFHDAGRLRVADKDVQEYCAGIDDIITEATLYGQNWCPTGIWNVLSRGFVVIQLKY